MLLKIQTLQEKIGNRIDRAIDYCCKRNIIVIDDQHYFNTNISRLIIYLIIGLFLGFILWAGLISIDKVVVATGKLTTIVPKITIKPYDKSIIKAIYVNVGDFVKKDTPLVALDTTFSQADLQELQQQLYNINTKIARIKAELDSREYYQTINSNDNPNSLLEKTIYDQEMTSFKSSSNDFENNITQLQGAKKSSEQNIGAYQQELNYAKKIEKIEQTAFKNHYVTSIQYFQAQQNSKDLQIKFNTELNNRDELAKKTIGANNAYQQFKADRSAKLAQELLATENERLSIEEQLKKANLANDLKTIRAPEDAVIVEISKQISVNTVIDSSQTIINLVPISAPLEVAAILETRDIGWVKLNDKADIHLETFPFQKYGDLEGRVLSITPDESEDAKFPEYKIRIEIEKNNLRNLPRLFHLIPGMITDANIIVGKRKIISYFLDPIIESLQSSFHEPG